LGSRPLRRKPPERGRALLGLVCLPLFILEVLGRAALSRSLLVRALSLLELALAAWGLERRLEEGLGERARRGARS
jgi:AraC-like DNA-binding protein